MNDQMVFNAKVLLFGEYGIVRGSKGLAVPFNLFKGHLENSQKSSRTDPLMNIVEHIQRSKILKKEMDVERLKKDVESGLQFNSNIPQGYGLGSSGALCAALFAKYSYHYDRNKKYDSEELGYIQELLSLIESHYHGTSSGLDPLISFFNSSILILSGQVIKFVERPNLEQFGQFYLLDSGIQRKTSPLVHQFLKDCSDEKYLEGINKFINLNEGLINNVMLGDKLDFKKNMLELSKIQYLYFDKMIPQAIREIWLAGLESKEYFMKLCGAGGGGFFLIYSPTGKIPLSHTLIKYTN